MVQTSHAKRYFSYLIQSNKVIWSITYVSLDLIPSTFCGACKCHFRTTLILKLSALKFPLIFAFDLSQFLRSKFV